MTDTDDTDLVLAVLELRERLDRAEERLWRMETEGAETARHMMHAAAVMVGAMQRFIDATHQPE